MAETFALETPIRGAASHSGCGLYRFDLTRDWTSREHSRRACFVMLNPSTADATKDDPTMTRCRNFARSWGYDGLAIVNLFALRATDPRELRLAIDPVHPGNDRILLARARASGLVVCAWGARGTYLGRAAKVVGMLRGAGLALHTLRLTKDGHPEHPLYLPARLEPTPWEPAHA